MPVPTHFKFTFRGIFNGSLEEWSFGAHFKRDFPSGTDAGLDDINEGQVTTALAGLLQGVPTSQAVWATDWRAYQIGTNGRMEGNPKVVDVSAETSCRGTNTNKYPPQIATCITLVASNRGPARFGRFYLPGPTTPIAGDMRMSDVDAGSIATSASGFLKNVSDAIDFPFGPTSSECINVSTRGGSAGTKQTVDHVEVGRVLDTIRTRRNKLLEERHVDAHIDW